MQQAALEANKENRKKRIVEAAIQVITRDKSVNMNLEEVVSLAGTSKSAVYQLFENKEGLLIEICESILFDSSGLCLAKLSTSNSMRDDLIAHVKNFLDVSYSQEYSDVLRLIHANISQSDLVAKKFFQIAVQDALKNMQNYLSNRVSEGRLSVEDCHIAAKHLIGSVVWFEQFQVLCHGGQNLSQKDMLAQSATVIDNFLLAHSVENT